MKVIILIFMVVQCITAWAIDLNLPASAHQTSLSGLTLLTREPASAFLNPALNFPGITTSTIILYSREDLPLYQISVAHRYKKLGFSIGCSYLDNNYYNEITSVLNLSFKTDKILSGISLRLLSSRVLNYHSSNSYLLDGAVIWITGVSKTSLIYRNISAAKHSGIKLPVFICWESSFIPGKGIELGLSFEKQSLEDFIFKLGTTYRINGNLNLSSSYQYRPQRLGFGMNCYLSGFSLNYGILTHQYLPLTHSVSITYEFLQ